MVLTQPLPVTSPEVMRSQARKHQQGENTVAKKTIELQYEGVEFVNRKGEDATADFREEDAKRAFLRIQESHSEEQKASEKPVRVYRTSDLGRRLLARFYGSAKETDAQEFADLMNANYATLGMYKAIVG